MNDLRKAAEMALEFVSWFAGDDHSIRPKHKAPEIAEALRQALDDKPPVKSYCGGVPNYCTPQPEVCCGEYARCLKVCIPKERWFAQQNYCTPEVTGEVTGEVPCKTHPDAPHGFNRNASFDEDRYVCDCEFWEPPEETLILDRGCYERGCVAYDERDGDGVYMSEKRVHKSDKSMHEPVGWLDSEGRFSYFKHLDSDVPLYLAPPVSDYHEGWEEGFKAAKRDNSSWVGLTDDEIVDLAFSVDSYKGLVQATEAKLKEKNGG